MLIPPSELVFLVGRFPNGKLFSERLENGGFRDNDVVSYWVPLIVDLRVMEGSGGRENDGSESRGIETDGRSKDEIESDGNANDGMDRGGIVVCVAVPVDGGGATPKNEED